MNKIGLIVAMDKEFDEIQALLCSYTTSSIGQNKAVCGYLDNKQIIMTQSGIGKVNAALACRQLIDLHPDLDIVISTGVAGGASTSLEIMDVVASTNCAYHDVYCGMNNHYGQIQGMPTQYPSNQEVLEKISTLQTQTKIHQGQIVTGDWFVDTTDKMREILDHFPSALAVDMESTAIAQTCYLSDMPFISLRIISDIPLKENNTAQYENFWQELSKKSFEVTKLILKSL